MQPDQIYRNGDLNPELLSQEDMRVRTIGDAVDMMLRATQGVVIEFRQDVSAEQPMGHLAVVESETEIANSNPTPSFKAQPAIAENVVPLSMADQARQKIYAAYQDFPDLIEMDGRFRNAA